uniref:E3 ubiquitin-protein ligase TRIM33 n=1 Tax=Onchocerca volvulus TaxID=6282 RepID=A0A8R1TTV4_ONCVO
MGEDFSRCDLCRAKLCGFSPPAHLAPLTALLPCLHAFCPSCKVKCEQASVNQETLVCQVCRTECLRSHVLDLPNANDCAVRRCESAACPDKHQATTKCIICNEALCADCSLAHQRVTATSSHFLQTLCPVTPKCVRCRLHSNMKIVSLCQCGSYVCMTCVASRLHEGPSHMITPLSNLPNAHVDENKIMSSTVRETTHIDCSLSMIQVRKNALSERVANLKKEVGNQVVHICQAVMRRGNDLLRALDAVQFYKGQEYDKLRNELLWQKRRFSRINSYASRIKDFEDLTTLMIMRQFLENCIIVIKSKKVSSERSLNGLQRPATVQFKPDTEHVLANISQWGRIFAEVDDLGTLKTVEVTPTPLSSNPIDVPLFDTATNRSRGSCLPTNIYTQRSSVNGSVGPSNSNPITLRPPVPQEHSRLLQQQQFHVQELAARQMQNARRQGFSQSQFLSSLLTEGPQRPGSIQVPGPRYAFPYASGIATTERPCVSPYTLPAGQMLPYASQRMFLPSSMPAQQPSTSNLVETYNSKTNYIVGIHRAPNVQLTSLRSGSSLSGTLFASGIHTNSAVRRSGESLIQTSRIGMVNSLPVSSSDLLSTFSATTLSISSSSASNADDAQSTNSSNTPILCSQNVDTSATNDRSDVCFNLPASNFGVISSAQQKCAPVSSGTSSGTCVSSPPPKDPEPAPLKKTVSIKKCNNDEVVKISNISKTQLDQSKQSDREQLRTGTEQQFQANDSADNDESRWDDYCYVCQQGCDEKTGSLGCCARCPRVFHNICHIPAIKEQMENLPDEWACSLCAEAEPLHENSGTIGQRERLLCSKILLSCYEKHLDVEPFCHPVPRTVVSYHVIIKQPMDFSTIARRLKEKSKDAFTNIAQFIQCMNLVFENCSTFNAPGDEVAKAGRSVYQIYSRAVKEYLPCMKSQVWLYVNRYSENRHTGLMQKEQNAQASSSIIRVHETSAEPVTKKPRKEVKSEFSETA